MLSELFQRLAGRQAQGPAPAPSRAVGRAPGALRKPDGSTYALALYKYDSCPYCRRVLSVVAELGIEMEMRDILADRQHRADLIEATGRGTVPCLWIEGRFMHESADIVRWLRAQVAKEPSA